MNHHVISLKLNQYFNINKLVLNNVHKIHINQQYRNNVFNNVLIVNNMIKMEYVLMNVNIKLIIRINKVYNNIFV